MTHEQKSNKSHDAVWYTSQIHVFTEDYGVFVTHLTTMHLQLGCLIPKILTALPVTYLNVHYILKFELGRNNDEFRTLIRKCGKYNF
jgi:hypothetical protein